MVGTGIDETGWVVIFELGMSDVFNVDELKVDLDVDGVGSVCVYGSTVDDSMVAKVGVVEEVLVNGSVEVREAVVDDSGNIEDVVLIVSSVVDVDESKVVKLPSVVNNSDILETDNDVLKVGVVEVGVVVSSVVTGDIVVVSM